MRDGFLNESDKNAGQFDVRKASHSFINLAEKMKQLLLDEKTADTKFNNDPTDR